MPAIRRTIRLQTRTELLELWQREWDDNNTGRWTHRLLPNLIAWVGRTHGVLSYHLTQALSGHACFETYLFRMRKCASPTCRHCGEDDDTAAHTLFRCLAWAASRYFLVFVLDSLFDAATFQDRLLSGPAAGHH